MSTDLSIQQRVFRNSLVGFFTFILSLLQAIIIVPVLLIYWGNSTYGVWLSLYAGFTLLQSLDMGHINYIGNKLNIVFHTDHEELKKTLGSSFLTAFFIGALQILLVIFLVIFNLVPSFLGIDPLLSSKYSLPLSLLILMTFWFISGSFGGILHRLMIPCGLYYESQWWGILYRFCQFFSIVITAVLGGSVLEAIISYVLIQFLVFTLTFIYIKRKIPEFYPCWKGAQLSTSFYNFRKSLVLTINVFVQQLSTNGIILFLSNILSSALVPAFTTLRTITNTAITITSLLLNSLLPDIVRYHAKKEIDKLNSVFNAHWFFSGAIINIGLLLILPFINNIYTFWTKGLLQFDYPLFITLAASISLINFGAGYYFYLVSINNLISQIAITFARAIIIFSSGFFLVKEFGLVGIGVAIMLSEVICSVFLPTLFVNIELRQTNIKLFRKYYFLALISPALIFVMALLVILLDHLNIYIWVIILITICLIYIYNWYILDEEVKDRSINLLRNIFQIRL